MSVNTRVVTIQNKRGLHARAAAKLAQVTGKFNARVTVTRGTQTVTGASIMGLMMLAASSGTKVSITATGEQSKAALDAICNLIEAKFEED